jgi:hypothetical protein
VQEDEAKLSPMLNQQVSHPAHHEFHLICLAGCCTWSSQPSLLLYPTVTTRRIREAPHPLGHLSNDAICTRERWFRRAIRYLRGRVARFCSDMVLIFCRGTYKGAALRFTVSCDAVTSDSSISTWFTTRKPLRTDPSLEK